MCVCVWVDTRVAFGLSVARLPAAGLCRRPSWRNLPADNVHLRLGLTIILCICRRREPIENFHGTLKHPEGGGFLALTAPAERNLLALADAGFLGACLDVYVDRVALRGPRRVGRATAAQCEGERERARESARERKR